MSAAPDPETTVTTDDRMAPTDDDTTTSTGEPQGTPGGGSKARAALPIILGLACVAMAVVVGLLGWQAWSAAQAERDATAALDAARTWTPQVLSYEPKTIDADIARARTQISGTFATQFEQLVTSVVLPASRGEGLSSKVDVTHAALIDSRPGQAEVLLLLHQAVASNAQPKPQDNTIQVKVTVTKAPDGQWLISNLQPI